MSPGPSRELMLHFSLAATGGQPEGGSRPQSSPKNGDGGVRGSSRSGAGALQQSRGERAAGRLLQLLEKVQLEMCRLK